VSGSDSLGWLTGLQLVLMVVGQFLIPFAKLQKATDRLFMSVCPFFRFSTWNNSATSEGIFMKILYFFENL
jgi:hypothetical protein